MKYLLDENQNITDVVLNIKLFEELPTKIKDDLMFGKPYEEDENDLILSEEEYKDFDEAMKELKDGKTRKL
jgi:hypothetical protein